MHRLACLTLLPICVWAHNAGSAEPQDRTKLLTAFNKEFVAITPGKGKFNAPKKALGEFAIAKYEMTQQLYEAVMGRNPSRWKGTRNSVESISYIEAANFCNRATVIMRNAKLIQSNEEIRLPTEAEWEYACRAGTKSDYSFGDSATEAGDSEPKAALLSKYAWHHGNAAGNDPEVGVLQPNPWGLYDMHGYLWEYVLDPWRPTVDGPPNSFLPGSTQQTMRGGSWRDHHSQCKSSTRWAVPDHVRSDAIGFRCVRANVFKE